MTKLATIESGLKGGGLKTNFEKLCSVVRAFKPDEVKLARQYLVLGHLEKYKGMTSRLFELLLAQPNLSVAACMERLDIGQHALDQTVIRLKEKLGYVLINENSTNKEGAYSPRYQAFFSCKHYIMQYQILIKRGAVQEAYDKLLTVIDLGKKYEWYDSLIEALLLQIEYLSKTTEFSSIEEIDQQVVYYEMCRRHVRKARFIFDELSNEMKKVVVREEQVAIYAKNIEHLLDLNRMTPSAMIGYQLLKLQINHSVLSNDFVGAELQAQQLLNLVTNSAALKQPDLISIAAIYIAESLIPQHRYQEALSYTLSARTNFPQYSINYGETLELEYHIQLYSGNPERSAAIMVELLDTANYPTTVYHRNRRRYMLGCALFAQTKYDEALDVLHEISGIHYDKSGWKIGIRMLLILLYKNSGDSAALDRLFDSWHRNLASIRKHASISKRDLKLFALLYKLCKSSATWADFCKDNATAFDELATHPELKWTPATHELIDVAEWLQSKGARKQYATVIAKRALSNANVR